MSSSPHIGLFTGMTVSLNASGYASGPYTLTRTGVDTATFPVTCNGSVNGDFTANGNIIDSDDFVGFQSTDVGLNAIHWVSGTPGSFSITFYDYSSGSGPGGQSWNPVSGDRFVFKSMHGNNFGIAPGGLLFHQPYYTVNTHAGVISSISWNAGTLTANTASAHGITNGTTVSMGITGSGALGNPLGLGLTCTITSATQFTCPLASDPGTTTLPGNYNTSQLATTKGGTPLAITDSNDFGHDVAALPANPPSGYWVDYPGNANYPTNAWGAANAMIASGVTGLGDYLAAVENRLLYEQTYFNNGTGSTFNGLGSTRAGRHFQGDPKNAMQSSFGPPGGLPPPGPPNHGRRMWLH